MTSRILGSFGAQVLGTGLSLIELQLLGLLAEASPFALSLYEINLRLPFLQSVVSITVNDLISKGFLLEYRRRVGNARAFVQLSTEGLELWRACAETASRNLDPGKRALLPDEQGALLELLRRIGAPLTLKPLPKKLRGMPVFYRFAQTQSEESLPLLQFSIVHGDTELGVVTAKRDSNRAEYQVTARTQDIPVSALQAVLRAIRAR